MKSFSTSILTSNEVQTAATRVDEIISANIAADPFITKAQPLLKASIANLSLAHGRTIDSTHVKLLAEKDMVRDTRYLALRDFCKAMSADADAALSVPAHLLVDIFKVLGWSMHLEGYANESSLIQALIDKLEKAPASAALTTIGATARLTGLKNAQVDFETTYKNKVDAKAKEEYPKIRECRKSIARYLGAILGYIDVMAEIDGGAFKATSGKIDEVITEFETIAHNRQTRKKNDDTKPPTGTTK